jgi:hypothetical protein
MENTKIPVIVSYGAGVDSTAVLVGMFKRGETPDAILFADTGAEKPETIAYIDTINVWLRSVGFPTVTVVRRFGEDGQFGPHSRPNKTGPGYRDIVEKTKQHGDLPSLAYRRKGCSIKFKGEVMDKYLTRVEDKGVGYDTLVGEPLKNGRLLSPAYRSHHTCSIKFKIDPVDRKLETNELVREARAAGIKPIRVIGYDDSIADRKRSKKAKARTDDVWAYWYPLQDWKWDRQECINQIASVGLPIPMKSACWFCPASQKWEILWLAAEHPELLATALLVEDNAQAGLKGGIKGLGGCGNFAWREWLEQAGVIEGYNVVMNRADIDRKWRAMAKADNALDGRTFKGIAVKVA